MLRISPPTLIHSKNLTGSSFPTRKFHHTHTKQPFRTFVQMDATGADQIWSSLGDAIDEIHHRNASSLSFEELYRNAYNLVLHKHGDLLYSGVSDRLATHLLETVQRLADIPDSSLLEEMAHAWSEREFITVGNKSRRQSVLLDRVIALL